MTHQNEEEQKLKAELLLAKSAISKLKKQKKVLVKAIEEMRAEKLDHKGSHDTNKKMKDVAVDNGSGSRSTEPQSASSKELLGAAQIQMFKKKLPDDGEASLKGEEEGGGGRGEEEEEEEEFHTRNHQPRTLVPEKESESVKLSNTAAAIASEGPSTPQNSDTANSQAAPLVSSPAMETLWSMFSSAKTAFGMDDGLMTEDTRETDTSEKGDVKKVMDWGVLGNKDMQVKVRSILCKDDPVKIKSMYNWLGHVIDGQPVHRMPSRGVEISDIPIEAAYEFFDACIPFLSQKRPDLVVTCLMRPLEGKWDTDAKSWPWNGSPSDTRGRVNVRILVATRK